MPIVKVRPTGEHPMPYNMVDEAPGTFMEEVAVAGNTAELQVALGADLGMKDYNARNGQAALLRDALATENAAPLKGLPVAYAAASFLREYASRLALDVASVRSAVTNKLLELANCGDPKFELRALELLGKHSDIGLFTERSELTINYKTPEDLENAIKERVKRLLNANIVDVTPVYDTLEAELGVSMLLTEFEAEAEAEAEPFE